LIYPFYYVKVSKLNHLISGTVSDHLNLKNHQSAK